MLPVLFTIAISAAWAKPAVLAVALAVVGIRAFLALRAARAAGERATLVGVLRDDAWVIAIVAVAVASLWRGGLLDADVRIPLHTYGVLIATAFVGGTWLAQREARRQGQDPERIADLAFWVLIAALVGSSVYFMLVNWRDYFLPDSWLVRQPFLARALDLVTLGAFGIQRVPRFLVFWEGGLVFYGGFIAAALTAAWYMRRHGMRFLPHADTLIPSVALGHVLGRLGCFSAGCCWGDVCDPRLPWAVRFPPGSLAYQTFAGRTDPAAFLAPDRLSTLPLHPTQLYEAMGELGIFLLLVLWVRPRTRFDGPVLATWLGLYAVLRTVVELFRGDVERGVYLGLGAGQWTSIAIFAAGVAIWLRARRTALDAPRSAAREAA